MYKNKVILIGNLGEDVKTKTFDNGNKVSNFSLATSETYTNKQGEKVTDTEWHNIVVRNKLSDICEKYLSKGDKIYLEGKIKQRSYEKDGIKNYVTEIHAFDVTFLTTKKESSSNSQVQQNDNDDLPF